jgi:hypothetical protein
MKKRPKIILRKRIQNAEMISGFEKLSKIDLPKPPIEIPVELHMETVQWEMDMTKESSRKEYKKLLDLFNLPFKTENASRLKLLMRRKCWYDVFFEVYAIEY